jgi:hypothetical protein
MINLFASRKGVQERSLAAAWGISTTFPLIRG